MNLTVFLGNTFICAMAKVKVVLWSQKELFFLLVNTLKAIGVKIGVIGNPLMMVGPDKHAIYFHVLYLSCFACP